jgi:hypothetical protein
MNGASIACHPFEYAKDFVRDREAPDAGRLWSRRAANLRS